MRLSLPIFCLLFLVVCPSAPAQTKLPAPLYEFRKDHDPNGIGKFFMGREIAHVMGHQAADWLERPEREEEERVSLMLQSLPLKRGEVAADIGAGTGYITKGLAEKVQASGKVFAVDIQPEMLTLLTNKMRSMQISNVVAVLGSITNANLPSNSVDLVLMVDVYHEFSHPYEMMRSISSALKPSGRVVFVEFRGEDPTVPIKEVHKITQAQLRKEMALHPLEWVETKNILPRQHIVVFRKKAS